MKRAPQLMADSRYCARITMNEKIMMTYDMIKNIPTSRDGKMITGILCAVMARLMLHKGMDTLSENAGDALLAFGFTGVLVFVMLLAIARYNTERPLFEPFGQK
jgi:hypothetical protein